MNLLYVSLMYSFTVFDLLLILEQVACLNRGTDIYVHVCVKVTRVLMLGF